MSNYLKTFTIAALCLGGAMHLSAAETPLLPQPGKMQMGWGTVKNGCSIQGNPLKVGGQAVSGIGVTGPAYSAGGSVKWTLSPTNDYRLLTFDVARDDRWTSGISDGALKLLINGVQVDSYGILDVANGGPAPGFRKTYSYLLSGASTIEFTMGGGGWGGASKAYYDIIDPRLIAVPEPAALGLLALGSLAIARRRRG